MKWVIFVCVANSNRSQMAEMFARLPGVGKVEAYSANFRPSGRINAKVVEAMREVGYDLTAHQSKGLGGFNGQEFDAAVTMGCGDECPYVPGRRYLDWELEDPAGRSVEEVRPIRDEIDRRVRALLNELWVAAC